MSYNIYLFADLFSICYITKSTTSNLVFMNTKAHIEQPQQQKKKNHCRCHYQFPKHHLFPSTNLHCLLSAHLSTFHKPHLILHLSQLHRTFMSPYHLYYQILSISAQTPKMSPVPNHSEQQTKTHTAEPSHEHTRPSMWG